MIGSGYARFTSQITTPDFERGIFTHLEQIATKVESWKEIDQLILFLEGFYPIQLKTWENEMKFLGNKWANGQIHEMENNKIILRQYRDHMGRVSIDMKS